MANEKNKKQTDSMGKEFKLLMIFYIALYIVVFLQTKEIFK